MLRTFPICMSLFALVFASAACSSSSKKKDAAVVSPDSAGPDLAGQPDVAAPADDASIVNPPDSTGLDGNGGEASAAGRLLITPTTANFPTNQALVFGILNAGDSGIGPLSVKITGTNAADFIAIATGCESLPTFGATCTISVSFTQTSVCSESAELVVTGPAPDFVTVTATLTGGVHPTPNPLAITPVAGDFGRVAVGTTSQPLTFTLNNGKPDCEKNSSVGPLTVALPSDEFVLTQDTCSKIVLPAGGACTFGAVFRPLSAGAKNATLLVTDDSGNRTAKTLTGTGIVF
jgi:hypothetical protein